MATMTLQTKIKRILENLSDKAQAGVKQILASVLPDSPPKAAFAQPVPNNATRPALQHTGLYPALPPGTIQIVQRNGTAPPPHHLDESRILTVLGTDITSGEAVTIPLKERLLGMYVIGATGTGKTTFDLSLILSDIRQGRGICLVEPHGDQTRQVIAAMPQEKLKDVIYLDLTDCTSSFSLNLFECQRGADVTEVAKVASFVMHVFEKVWNVGTETPRLQQVLRNTTRVLIENPAMTFAEIPLLLWQDAVREKLVRRVTNTQTKLFWSQYNRKPPRDRDELIASTINKVDAYLNEPLVSRIVSQSASTIDFRQIMDDGKILLVNLSPQLEEASRLIGAVIIGRLLMAAFSRSDTPEHRRRPFMLYCDEFQRFATSDFATFLAEARKFKIGTTISNQTLEQLDDINCATALQAGTQVVFRVSGDDSKVLTRSFDSTPQLTLVGEEPIRATAADPISHLVRHSSAHPVVAKFTQEYLMELEVLLKESSSSPHTFGLGCAFVHSNHVSRGRQELNECLARCMREGTADIVVPQMALFMLAAASSPESTYVFAKDLRYETFGPMYIQGFCGTSAAYGKPDFLSQKHEQEDMRFLRRMTKSMWVGRATVDYRVSRFARMIKALRATMAILAREPILVDTGQFKPKYQLRSYIDQENLVANDLSQLPNYTAKVRLLTGEHTIRSNPPPQLPSDREIEARIRAIKQHMAREGYTKSAATIEEEVRKRHEALRERPPSDTPPPLHSNGRRQGRQKPPPRTETGDR